MNKTILIGLDGATFSILDLLMNDGTMPFLKQFVSRGVRAKLLSTVHPLTPPAFTSMATGRSPGNHGIYDFVKSEEKDGKIFFTLYDSRDIKCETVWSIASRQNLKVGLINYIMTSPPKPLNGYVIPGMVHWRHLRRNIYPEGLYEEIKEQLPGFDAKKLAWDFKQEEKAVLFMPDEEYREWVIHHLERERQWFQITRYLMKERPSELMAVVFDGGDKIQHICWEFLDPHFFQPNPSSWESEVRQLCLQYFRELDGYLKEIVSLAGPNANIFIVSDHGFGPTHTKFNANQLLQNFGYLSWKEDYPDTEEKSARERENIELDWDKTIAYARTRSNNGIYIRIAQKAGQSGIEPKLYRAFREKLSKQLLDFKDPSTGQQIVKKVIPREEAFPGSLTAEAPDLTLVLYDYGFISIANKGSAVEQRQRVGGTHYPQGIFIAAGPHIRKGSEISELSLMDTGPIMLYSLNLPVPQDFEGKVPLSIFEEGYLSKNPVLTGPPANNAGQSRDSGIKTEKDEIRTEEEKQEIYSHLKALGYMD